MELIEHRYSDRPARFYVDGVRVSRERWEDLTAPLPWWWRAHPKARLLAGTAVVVGDGWTKIPHKA